MVISRPMMIVAGAAMDSAETPAAVFVHSSTSAAATAEFVRDGVEERAEGGHEVHLAREVAVEPSP